MSRVIEEQGGFKEKKSCIDQVAIKKRRELLVAFMDLEKASRSNML